MVSRGSNTISHRDIANAFPRLRTSVIDIDRRTYMGNIEPAAPNETFGFDRLYGPGRCAANPPAMPCRAGPGRAERIIARQFFRQPTTIFCGVTWRPARENNAAACAWTISDPFSTSCLPGRRKSAREPRIQLTVGCATVCMVFELFLTRCLQKNRSRLIATAPR